MALAAWTQPGTYSWYIPAGVTSIKVYAVAGGGGGGAARAADASGRGEGGGFGAASGGGGAGGQAGSLINFSVQPGEEATITVGGGGTAGTNLSEAGGTGGNTTFAMNSVYHLVVYGGYGGFPDCNQPNQISNTNVTQAWATYNLRTNKGKGGDSQYGPGGAQNLTGCPIDEAYGGGGAGTTSNGGVGNTAPGTRGSPTEFTDSNGLGTIYVGQGGLGGQSVLSGGYSGIDGLGQGGGGGSSQRYMGEELTLQGGAGGCGGVYITYTQSLGASRFGHQIGQTGDTAGQQRIKHLQSGSQIITNHDGASYGQIWFANSAGTYKMLIRKSNSSGNGIALAYHADFINNVYLSQVSNCILMPYPASGSPAVLQLGTETIIDCYGSGNVAQRQYELVDGGYYIAHRFVRYFFNCVCDCVCACDCV